MKILSLKNKNSRLQVLEVLFYLFPLIMLMSSGYITFYISILTIYSLYVFFYKKIKINFILLDYLIFLFFIISIVASLINIKVIGNFIFFKSIFDLRFALFFVVIRNIINSRFINIKFFFISSLICSIFLSLNIFSQHIIGFDAFGHEPFDGRYNGLFESEAIAGSYIQKFFLVSILSILLLKIQKKTKFILTIIATNILGLGVLLSLDRMPFIIYLFSIILLIALLKNFRLKFLISLILIIFIFQFSFNNYEPVKNRYMSLSNEFQLSKIKNIFSFYNKKEELSAKKNKNEDYNLSGDYLRIYVAAYKVFLENFFVGSGVKSFGIECNKLKENNKKNITCSTHPHNIYMEILVNQGIIGILIFIIFLFSLIKNNYLKELFSKNSSEEKLLIIFFFTILISELLPFRSYGSIFQTVNGSIFWFFLALISSKPFMKKN